MNPSSTLVACLLFGVLAAQDHTSPAPKDAYDAFRAQAEQLVTETMKRDRVPGMSLLVAFDKTIVMAKGYGMADLEHEVPMTPKSVFRIGSITKQFTAAAILKLVDAGKLHLDDKLNDVLPAFGFPGKNVTVHQLLNHTSGIKSFTGLGAKSRGLKNRPLTHRQTYELIKDEPFDFEPGTSFRYNNSGYYLLGLIIEKVSGKKYRTYLAKELWQTSGLTETYYGSAQRIIPHRARGYSRSMFVTQNAAPISMRPPFAAGALRSTTRDLHRWNLALHGGQLLSPDSYAKMTTATGREAPSRPPTYGYGIEINEREGRQVIEHGGSISGFRCMLSFFPKEQLTVALLYNTDKAGPGPLAAKIAKAALAVKR